MSMKQQMIELFEVGETRTVSWLAEKFNTTEATINARLHEINYDNFEIAKINIKMSNDKWGTLVGRKALPGRVSKKVAA